MDGGGNNSGATITTNIDDKKNVAAEAEADTKDPSVERAAAVEAHGADPTATVTTPAVPAAGGREGSTSESIDIENRPGFGPGPGPGPVPRVQHRQSYQQHSMGPPVILTAATVHHNQHQQQQQLHQQQQDGGNGTTGGDGRSSVRGGQHPPDQAAAATAAMFHPPPSQQQQQDPTMAMQIQLPMTMYNQQQHQDQQHPPLQFYPPKGPPPIGGPYPPPPPPLQQYQQQHPFTTASYPNPGAAMQMQMHIMNPSMPAKISMPPMVSMNQGQQEGGDGGGGGGAATNVPQTITVVGGGVSAQMNEHQQHQYHHQHQLQIQHHQYYHQLGQQPPSMILPPPLPPPPPVMLTEDSLKALVKDSTLVEEKDRDLIPDALYIAIGQLKLCKQTKSDQVGSYKDRPIDFVGLCCKWCNGQPGFGRYFPNSCRSLAQTTTSTTIIKHMSAKCRSVPTAIKKAVFELDRQQRHRHVHYHDMHHVHNQNQNGQDGGPGNAGTDRPRYGSRKIFFQRLWERIHGNKDGSADGGEKGTKEVAEETDGSQTNDDKADKDNIEMNTESSRKRKAATTMTADNSGETSSEDVEKDKALKVSKME